MFLVLLTVTTFHAKIVSASNNGVLISQAITLPNVANYNNAVQDPGIGGRAEDKFSALIVGLVLNVRYILGTIAIAMLVIAGVRLVMAQGNEEVFTKQKSVIIWSIIGLTIVGFAGEISRIFSVGECPQIAQLPGTSNLTCIKGGFLKDPNAILSRTTMFNQTTQIAITFIKYTIGGLAILMMMRNAFRLVTNGGGDEIEIDKKNLIWSAIGLFMIIVADNIVNNVVFKIDTSKYPPQGAPQPAIDYGQGIKEIIGFTNFLVTLMSPFAILMLIVGGIMYVTSAGDEEAQSKAKRIITLALVGLLIIYGAFAVVTTFISRQALDVTAASATAFIPFIS